MAIVFKCTQCGQAMRAKPESAGKLCKCTQCGTLVRIAGPAIQPVVKAKPARPAGPPRNPLLEELDNLAASGGHQPYPSTPIRDPSPSFGPQAPRPKKPRKKKGSSSSGAKTVVTVLLSILGVLGVLCCGGLGVAGVMLGPKTIVLKAGGYQAVAKGKQTKQESTPQGNTSGTMHPFTGSEFWIGSVIMPVGNAATIEDARPYFQSISARTELVQRGSLRGIHCYDVKTRQLGVLGGTTCDMELFMVGGRLLFTAYIPGTSKSLARGRTVSAASEARARAFDNSDAFFSSLRPAEN